MNEPGIQSLMDRETLERRVQAGEMPSWVVDHWETFRSGLLGERNGTPFPCFLVQNRSSGATRSTPPSPR